mmetsp:Transcript_47123/g.151052  ORF Transcript_47123/g.151052 Transcript_47123/m.151052 type:complete len:764 (-) Transcript_47123:15-2306(-)
MGAGASALRAATLGRNPSSRSFNSDKSWDDSDIFKDAEDDDGSQDWGDFAPKRTYRNMPPPENHPWVPVYDVDGRRVWPRCLKSVTTAQRNMSVRKLYIYLMRARNLTAADWNLRGEGTSDPYVVVSCGGYEVKSKVIDRTLDPVWNEKFVFQACQYSGESLHIEVFDHDVGNDDDYLGGLEIPLDRVEEGNMARSRWAPLQPEAPPGPDVQGELHVRCFFDSDEPKVLHVFVIAAYDLEAADVAGWSGEATSDPYVTVRVGNQVKKTPVIQEDLNPEWNHHFKFIHSINAGWEIGPKSPDVVLFEVFDHDVLSADDGLGQVALPVSAIKGARMDSADYEAQPKVIPLQEHTSRRVVSGRLSVRVYWTDEEQTRLRVFVNRAVNIKAADVQGTSDPYVTIQVGDKQRQTKTVMKTVNPLWAQPFDFDFVSESVETIVFKVYDYDLLNSDDFLGCAELPLGEVGDIKTQERRSRWLDLKPLNEIGKLVQGDIQMRIFFSEASVPIDELSPRAIKPKSARASLFQKHNAKTMSRSHVSNRGVSRRRSIGAAGLSKTEIDAAFGKGGAGGSNPASASTSRRTMGGAVGGADLDMSRRLLPPPRADLAGDAGLPCDPFKRKYLQGIMIAVTTDTLDLYESKERFFLRAEDLCEPGRINSPTSTCLLMYNLDTHCIHALWEATSRLIVEKGYPMVVEFELSRHRPPTPAVALGAFLPNATFTGFPDFPVALKDLQLSQTLAIISQHGEESARMAVLARRSSEDEETMP